MGKFISTIGKDEWDIAMRGGLAAATQLPQKVNVGEITALQSMPTLDGGTTLAAVIAANIQSGNRVFGILARNLLDLPTADDYYYDVLAIMPGTGWVFASKMYSKTLYRRYMYDGAWAGDWEIDATATPPQELPLPLAAGITDAGCAYFKTQDNVVTVGGSVHGATPIASGSVVATLPEGYRTKRGFAFPVTCINTSSHAAGGVTVQTDGTIKLDAYGVVTGIRFSFSFIAQ